MLVCKFDYIMYNSSDHVREISCSELMADHVQFFAYNKVYMVGHQLVISLAYYNNNLPLQLYFTGSTTCYLEEVMMVPKNLPLRIQRGARAPPLHLPAGAHGGTRQGDLKR